ncbi:MAG: oxidoreductase, short chain dehydrogenase/reductase family [Verrucomicrobiales bacterium]|nr:oxidoreductase, short chain dehydrogenase/reductase family [Verrucomicrobiales bacterium]
MAQSFLIFGAAGGIGSALTRRLAQSQHQLFLSGRTRQKLEELARETGSNFEVADATQSEQVRRVFEQALRTMGSVTGVINCIGSLLLKPVVSTTDEEWLATITTNLSVSFYILRSAVQHMRQQGGAVILFSSVAARRGFANHEVIAAAKAGVEGLAVSAAASYAPANIRVNCVAPGLVDTPLTARITKNEHAAKASAAMHPLGRIGSPDQIASTIEWLVDPEQAWITGQIIHIDGGLSTVQPRSA